MKTKKILLIGGAGYVGTVITEYFLKKNYHVIILDNFIYDNFFSINSFSKNENLHIVNGKINDLYLLRKASKNVDYVVLLAGLVGDPITKNYPKTSHQINEIYLKKCIDFFDSKPIKKLIFISTCSNYGLISESELASETHTLNPLSLYAKSKVEIENYILSKKNKVNYCATILRFATAFGLSPRMRFDLTISQFTRDLYFGNSLTVFDEHTWRPYCHVKDFAELIDVVVNADEYLINFEIFNAGGQKNNATKKMIIDLITKNIANCNIVYSNNDSDPRNYRVDFNKVKNILGFVPKVTIEDGVLELINSLDKGLFRDSISDKYNYGNYKLNYSLD